MSLHNQVSISNGNVQSITNQVTLKPTSGVVLPPAAWELITDMLSEYRNSLDDKTAEDEGDEVSPEEVDSYIQVIEMQLAGGQMVYLPSLEGAKVALEIENPRQVTLGQEEWGYITEQLGYMANAAEMDKEDESAEGIRRLIGRMDVQLS